MGCGTSKNKGILDETLIKSAELGYLDMPPSSFRVGPPPEMIPHKVEIRGSYLVVFTKNGTVEKVTDMNSENIIIEINTKGWVRELRKINFSQQKKNNRLIKLGFQDTETANDWIETLKKLGMKAAPVLSGTNKSSFSISQSGSGSDYCVNCGTQQVESFQFCGGCGNGFD